MEKVGKSEAADCDEKEVAPTLIVGIFDVEVMGIKVFMFVIAWAR